MDLSEIRKAITALFNGQVVEVRMMDKKKRLTVAGWFDDYDALAKTVARLARDGYGESYKYIHENVFWTCNPVHAGLLARQPKNTVAFVEDATSDNNILSRRWIPVDIDPLRPSGVSATREEKALARDVTLNLGNKLLELGFPESCLVSGLSGNGYHILIRCELPNDKDALDLVKRCLAAMQVLAGTAKIDIDQKVCNAARIIKCYGTMACKGVDTEDRPWRMARLTDVPERIEPCSRELLEKLAAMVPVKGKGKEGEKRPGPWTDENTQAYLDWTGWECGDPVGYNGGLKWMGVCPNDDQHKDAAVLLTNGWWNFTCYHASCADFKTDEFKAYWEEENDEKYAYPKPKMARSAAFDVDDLDTPKPPMPVDLSNVQFKAKPEFEQPVAPETKTAAVKVGPVVEKAESTPEADAKAAYKKANADIYREIDAIMNPEVEKGEKMPPERERLRDASILLTKHLKTTGKLYNCGNVATYVDNHTHDLIEIVKGSPKFTRMMMNFGVGPEKLLDYFGKWMGAVATNSPENQVYAMSRYDKNRHVLYVNEYDNNFLKIASDGTVTRHQNGYEDMLFKDGNENFCDPLCADLAKLNANHALKPGGMIQQEILDTILYSENGVGRDDAHAILMTSILALFFYERVPSNPYIYLYGAGASMKSSLAVKVGKLLQGHRFAPRPSTEDEEKLKDMAMSMPFIVLDEANNLKRLMNILKTLATGGMDTRRELYTTCSMRHTPYQARIWMTANTASLTNETISARMMIIDAGERTETEPYRSEHYLIWSNERRNELWTELVARLSRAMVELRDADEAGQGDLTSAHRMSSFFVFGRTLARQEGWEKEFLAAMQAMDARQKVTSSEGNDILDLVEMLPASYANTPRKASDWAAILSALVREPNVELKRAVARTAYVAHQFTANQHMLTMKCGMFTKVDKKRHTTYYGFKNLNGHGTFVDEVAFGGVGADSPEGQSKAGEKAN